MLAFDEVIAPIKIRLDSLLRPLKKYILDADKPMRLFIPKEIATGLLNIGQEEAWLVNYPDPPYDPGLVDEQVEYTKEELEQGIIK